MASGAQHAGSKPVAEEAKKVICVSWIPQLARTRELLLRSAGFEVTTVLGERDLGMLDRITTADLLILAHSVPREQKVEALTLFRRNCSAPVLSLLQPYQVKLPGVDYAVEAFSPAAFLDAVREVTSPERPRWSVGCHSCDLIFKFGAHLAFPTGGPETVALQCPYCRHTCNYEVRELTRDDDTSAPT